MRRLGLVLLACCPAFAAVTGTVTNRSTGQPQAGATVGFFNFGQGGMQKAEETKADPQGRFTFNREPDAQGPTMLRVEVDGVTYNHMIPPGAPANGIAMDVYNASKEPGAAKVGKHMIMFQPSGGQMTVTETYLYENSGKTAWFDPKNGTLRFYLPAAAKGAVEVQGTAPDGMAVPVPTEKTSRADVYAAKFEIKPGETRFDVTYAVPYKEGEAYAGKVVTSDENTYLIAPSGVTLTGTGLNDLGLEPRTQAHIYGLTATSYKVQLAGTVAAAANAGGADASGAEQDAGPQIEQIMPRVYGGRILILGLALGILALGFVLLYRRTASGSEKG